jgi:NADPH-dependent 2,4-dienoyl-CoA reductase/sulfur reductase-like enzyme
VSQKINVVVGAGQAGSHAAIEMRKSGFEGRILLVGEERSLPYDRPPLSKSYLTAEYPEKLVYHFTPEIFEREKIELLVGLHVTALDLQAQTVSLSTGGMVAFDKLVMATGSAARQLDVPGGARAMGVRTYGDAYRLRSAFENASDVVCVGGGVIGLEIACAAISRGCQVTVVEVGSTVMERSLDPRIAARIEQLHRENGVKFEFTCSVVEVGAEDVLLSDGRRLKAEVVVAGIGIVRNLDLAVAAGLETARGIKVDCNGKTSNENVYAAGEVAEFFKPSEGQYLVQETWQHAQDHGGLVGRNVAGASDVYDAVPWFWSDQFGVNFQVTGQVKDFHQIVYRGDVDSPQFAAFCLTQEMKVCGAFGSSSGRDMRAAQRMISSGAEVNPADLENVDFNLRNLLRAKK